MWRNLQCLAVVVVVIVVVVVVAAVAVAVIKYDITENHYQIEQLKRKKWKLRFEKKDKKINVKVEAK